MALRKIPVPLLAAELGALIVATLGLFADRYSKNETALLTDGGQFASAVLAAVGFAWLVPLVSGAARTGVRVAMFAAAAKVVWSAVWLATLILVLTYTAPPPLMIFAGPFVKAVCSIAMFVGLGVATRRWWLVAAAMLPTIISFVVWKLNVDGVYPISHPHLVHIVQTTCSIASGLALLALTVVLCRDSATLDEPAPVVRGLRLSARALHALASATVMFVGGTLWISAATGHSAWLAHAVTEALQLASLCAFVAGGLIAVRGRGELPSWVIVVGAAIVLAVVSSLGTSVVVAFQLVLQPGPSHDFLLYPFPLLQSTSGLLLVELAIGGALVAIAIGARRRGLEQLHTSVLLRTGVFTVLALGALTVQQLLPRDEALEPGAAVLSFTSVGATLVAWLVAASAFSRGAREIAGEQSLPTAKLFRAT